MVFVTGATGLVGAYLIRQLIKNGEDVIALKRESSNVEDAEKIIAENLEAPEQIKSKLKWVVGDVLNKESIGPYLINIDVVYHCAAIVSFNGTDKEQLFNINIEGTRNICELCLENGKRLCFVSSIAALGDAKTKSEVVDENTPSIPGVPHSVYSQTKRKSEKVVWEYIDKGLNAVIVNPGIILGAGMNGRSSEKLLDQAIKGIPFYTLGVTGYVDVRDVVKAMVLLAEREDIKSERFVLCGGNYSYKQIFDVFARAAGKKPPYIKFGPIMTNVAWRSLALLSMVTGKKPAFTKETARSSQSKSYFSSYKIMSTIPEFRFHSLEETAEYFVKKCRGFGL